MRVSRTDGVTIGISGVRVTGRIKEILSDIGRWSTGAGWRRRRGVDGLLLKGGVNLSRSPPSDFTTRPRAANSAADIVLADGSGPVSFFRHSRIHSPSCLSAAVACLRSSDPRGSLSTWILSWEGLSLLDSIQSWLSGLTVRTAVNGFQWFGMACLAGPQSLCVVVMSSPGCLTRARKCCLPSGFWRCTTRRS